jgi:hypothetical protein
MAQLAKFPVIPDPFFDQLGGFSVQIQIDGFAADFASPLLVMWAAARTLNNAPVGNSNYR